jgi:O-antigen ligase
MILAIGALGLPMLLAFNLPPSSTFLNQAAAVTGWGAWLVALAGSQPRGRTPRSGGLLALHAALALLFVAALAAPRWAELPWSLSLSAAALIGATGFAAQIAANVSRSNLASSTFSAFCIGMVVAGALSSLIGVVQVFFPSLADGNLIAKTYIEGRAVGNLRQPNHLSSLLLWAIVAAVWLGEARVMRRWMSSALVLLFIFVVVLTASRTGAASMLVLTLWGLLDRRLSRHARWLLALAPLVYGVFWYGTGVWADATHHVFGGETRFSTKGDVSSSRLGIWSNTLALIRMHPWAGVGFGEFNFAWTLTPFPGRPVAFFDHTHNIVLQFVVELGIPLAALVLGLMLYALVCAFRGARAKADEAQAAAEPGLALLKPSAVVMVLLILLHSLLEYPLWYAYFLLPTAFAFGLCLAGPVIANATGPAADASRSRRPRWLVVASLVLMFGGFASLADYYRVVVIFAPAEGAPGLAQRVIEGRRSVFFSHHPDYAAATTAERPGDVMPAFRGAPHYLLDARLLQAWAIALDQSGDTERARYVAARLREFKNEQSAEFFAPCNEPAKAGKALPFQCVAPTKAFTYEDFR